MPAVQALIFHFVLLLLCLDVRFPPDFVLYLRDEVQSVFELVSAVHQILSLAEDLVIELD